MTDNNQGDHAAAREGAESSQPSSEEHQAAEPAPTGSDRALEDLLDDALNDFATDSRRPAAPLKPAEASSSGSASGAQAAPKFDPLGKRQAKQEQQRFAPLPARPDKGGRRHAKAPKPPDGPFGAIPPDIADLDGELSRGFEQLMRELAEADAGQLAAGAASAQEADSARPDSQFAATLRALSDTQAQLRQASGIPAASGSGAAAAAFSDPILQGLQEQLAAGGGGGGEDALGSFADGIMRQLLSKDVLYQPMKDIGARYPAWLEAHREQLPEAEWQRFSRQHGHIQEIVECYEQTPDDFPRLFAALQQMQACGQPPQDIVNDLAPGLAFDEDGLPQLPGEAAAGQGGPPGCSIQ